MHILHNNCHFYGDLALCGTRGWFYEEEKQGQNEKVFRRELARLETSLQAAGSREKLCFLHYPPFYTGYCCAPILELLERYQVRACYYGHLHGKAIQWAFEGDYGGIAFRLVSADALNFCPLRIKE